MCTGLEGKALLFFPLLYIPVTSWLELLGREFWLPGIINIIRSLRLLFPSLKDWKSLTFRLGLVHVLISYSSWTFPNILSLKNIFFLSNATEYMRSLRDEEFKLRVK